MMAHSRRVPTLIERLATEWPCELWSDVPVLIAVSGGSDSVALLHGLVQLASSTNTRLIVAHFNHQLRGQASDDDEQFVVELAERLHVACHVGRGDARAMAIEQGDGIEAAARAQRYGFLEATANAVGARYLLTAHTADDQAETILHRILRGTGVAGLAGIPRVRAVSEACSLVRPLLGFRRAELRAWLVEHGWTFREDASNFERDYTRNRLRLDLLPLLSRDYNPQVVEALLRLGRLAMEAQAVITAEVERWLPLQILRQSPTCVALRSLSQETQPADYILRETLIHVWQQQGWPLQAMTYEHWQRLVAIWRGEPISEYIFPSKVRARHQAGYLLLETSPPDNKPA